MKKKQNHLVTYTSFQFALSVALVATLVAVLITLVGQVGKMMTYSGRAAGMPYILDR